MMRYSYHNDADILYSVWLIGEKNIVFCPISLQFSYSSSSNTIPIKRNITSISLVFLPSTCGKSYTPLLLPYSS